MLTNLSNFIRPRELIVETSNNYAKVAVEPLERGYGTTLGNALRRVMLASIPGAAIKGINIEGALHEFSALPNIVEDVASIILNVKGIQIGTDVWEPQELIIDISGPARITAGDMNVPGTVTVLNPDHYIATVNEGGHLTMRLNTGTGVGYAVAEENKTDDDPANYIAVDSIYSPISRVNYRIASARVGQRTDYDKLVLEIWTNGSITGEEAVGFAAAILRDQFRVFTGDQEYLAEMKEEEVDTEEPELSEDLYRLVDDLELSVRSANCLKNANIRHIGELVQKTEDDLLQTKNFGRKSLKEIKEILASMNLTLNMEIDGFDPADAPDFD